MAVLCRDLLYLHIPKSGGRWVRAALRGCNHQWQEVGSYQPWVIGGKDYFGQMPAVIRNHSIPFETDAKTVLMFVRHPVDWLRSYWTHDGGRRGNIGGRFGNRRGRCDTFTEFAWQTVTNDPGIVGKLYEAYGEGFRVQHTPLKQASACLATLLDDPKIAACEIIGKGRPSIITEAVFNAVCNSEAAMIERFEMTSDYEEWLATKEQKGAA